MSLFSHIKDHVSAAFTPAILTSLKTTNGNTQSSERTYIQIISSALTDFGCSFSSAGSQQSKDLRNISHPNYNDSFHLEVKKTDKNTIMLNDTLPSSDTIYLVLSTKQTKDYSPQLLWIPGDDFISPDGWEYNYLQEINNLKQKYCLKKSPSFVAHSGILSSYCRPSFSANISSFLIKNS
jgi:hypothetical protein